MQVINRKLWGMKWVFQANTDTSQTEKQLYHKNPQREEPRKYYNYILTSHRKASQGYKRILETYLLPDCALKIQQHYLHPQPSYMTLIMV